jgi:adenosine deaminase|tara:strand:- start:1174 stop:2262 length:1089 start_codon:yes stop_codon:yes gene_type:complete
MLSPETIRTAPKVLLHDHLDGGLRPSTIIELAKDLGVTTLPTYNVTELGNWMTATADRKDLELYLEAFSHTLSVMQTEDGLYRVAAECAEDLANDGIIYAEVRFAPELHLSEGLTVPRVIERVLEGFRSGSEGKGIIVNTLICAIRSRTRSKEMMEHALHFRSRGVVGFDIAGPEIGYPPSAHIEAFKLAIDSDFPVTIHAGEVGGVDYIREAVKDCGASRIGHGLGLQEEISSTEAIAIGESELLSFFLDKQIALELCPTSNLHIGAIDSFSEHPISRFIDLGLCATINTDNRLMSNTSLSKELQICSETFGWEITTVHTLMRNALSRSFISSELKEDLNSVLSNWYYPISRARGTFNEQN